MNAVLDDKKPFLALCDALDQRPDAGRWRTVRHAARARFQTQAFPTARTEDWRFTSVAPILKQTYALSASAPGALALPPLCDPRAVRLVFVNGVFAPALSSSERLAGVALGHLAAPGDASDAVAKRLGRVADADALVFTALNTALLADGGFLIVPDGVALERPVEFLYVTLPGATPPTAQPRTLVDLGANASATVVERFVGVGEGTAFVNAVAEFALADGARLDHVKLQQENRQTYHVANSQATVAGRANFTTHSISFGAALARNEVRVRFTGEAAEATVNGLYHASGTQHLDNHTVIDHAVPRCVSHELYKGVLADKAHGVFNGKIFVRKDAQKTDAKQTNKALLLSDDATINTKPQLEIFADDVKCTHGATVGQLDPVQIHYLRSRGIGKEDARRLLTFAFANDVVSRIGLEGLREEIGAVLVGATS